MREFYIAIGTAAVGGLLMGAAFRPNENDLKGGPGGPQIIASQGPSEEELANISPIASRVGPLPDYVLGTDFTRPKHTLHAQRSKRPPGLSRRRRR